jgi:UDP-N-acetylmuramoyl-tripeptide--D-alanyl-D-alanine ligase
MTTRPAPLTLGFVRDALRGYAKLVSTSFDPNRRLRSVSIDSRTVHPEDLFVAIKGDIFDGHDFIEQAVAKGAQAILCQKYPAAAPQEGVDIFLVEDTLTSFRVLAQHWRQFIDPVVVAVAGSVGKTTTKDLLAALLSGKFKKLISTKGSQNGFVGLPLTLMELREDSEAAVIEVGIDAPDAMKQHIDLVRPEVALVTAISEEHLEWLHDLKTIAREENLILEETALAGGTAVINLDDPWIKPLMETLKASGKIGFSLGGAASPEVVSGQLKGNFLEVNGFNRLRFALHSPLPGEHNARNLLGAVAIALVLGVTPDEMEEGLSSFAPSGGRSQMEMLRSGVQVLCDFYNANPASMRASFQVIKELSSKENRKWLCLADMKELGTSEEELHRQLAKDINELGQNTNVLLYGEKMKWLADELGKIGSSVKTNHYSSFQEISNHLKHSMKSGDVVLLKGSRSMRMEKVWELIKD